MHHYHYEDLASSDNVIIAIPVCTSTEQVQDYHFKRKEYPNIYIPNRTLAWFLSAKEEQSKEIKSLRKDIDEYNNYLERIEAIPGFLEYFKQHQFCVAKEYISKKWSEETAKAIFKKRNYCFTTELTVFDDFIFDNSIPVTYQAQIEGEIINIPIGEPAEAYPSIIHGKTAIWNWVDNGHDFCFYLWQLLGERYVKNEENEEEDNSVHYYFEVYDQIRYDSPEPQLKNIFKKLESLGYLETYTLHAEQKDPRWIYFGKENGTIDLALIDPSFLKNKLLMEQIELLLWQPTEDIKDGQVFLTDKDGKQYISEYHGALGGHNKLKIYGKLNCPSALRYVEKGQYVQHRVFFENEETAIAAGYRPCAKCMSEAYKLWKTEITHTE